MSTLLYLSDDVRITKVKDHTTAATSGVTSDEVDMAADGGWDGVIFLTSFSVAAANNTITIHDGTTSGATAATVATKASGTSDEDVAIDVLLPRRFVQAVAARGTSSTLESIWAVQYRGRNKPIVNSITGTITVAKFTSPALA